jgi:hypothetical protein
MDGRRLVMNPYEKDIKEMRKVMEDSAIREIHERALDHIGGDRKIAEETYPFEKHKKEIKEMRQKKAKEDLEHTTALLNDICLTISDNDEYPARSSGAGKRNYTKEIETDASYDWDKEFEAKKKDLMEED